MPVDPLRAADPVRIGGHRIVGRLGAGGQGVVYLAESPSGERVAVKLLRADAVDSAAAGSRALAEPAKRAELAELAELDREIELALRVKAFCTAQVLEHGEFGGAPYIVSEYVDGPSLAQVISERGALRGTELRRLAIGTLTALSAIHQAGVVHRDLKPANVLLARDGPRVIDFGIARAADSEATTEHLVGTPPYMAPEQFNGAPAGPASDMFAWAATVTCAATGTPRSARGRCRRPSTGSCPASRSWAIWRRAAGAGPAVPGQGSGGAAERHDRAAAAAGPFRAAAAPAGRGARPGGRA
nr:hypothetical protein GCM10020093_049560 [Planobispora longispora]